jgi:purine-binding chemotaxis protein CheW
MAAQGAAATTKATSQALVVFSLYEQRYALALTSVQRVIRVVAITPLPEAPAIILGIIDLGGVVIPVINIRERFKHPPRDVRPSDHLLVATTGKRTVALLVDATKGVIEGSSAQYEPAGKILPGLELVDGALKLPDGLVLIHDIDSLLSLDDQTTIDRALDAVSTGKIAQGTTAATGDKPGSRRR